MRDSYLCFLHPPSHAPFEFEHGTDVPCDKKPVDAMMGCQPPLTDLSHLDRQNVRRGLWRQGTENCVTGWTAVKPSG